MSAVKKAKKLKQQKMCEDCGLRRSNYALPEEGEPASVLCHVGCGCARHLIRIWLCESPDSRMAVSAHIDFSALRLLLLLAPLLLLLLFLAPFAAASFDLLRARPGLEPGTRREVASPRSIKRPPLPGAWVYPHNVIPGKFDRGANVQAVIPNGHRLIPRVCVGQAEGEGGHQGSTLALALALAWP